MRVIGSTKRGEAGGGDGEKAGSGGDGAEAGGDAGDSIWDRQQLIARITKRKEQERKVFDHRGGPGAAAECVGGEPSELPCGEALEAVTAGGAAPPVVPMLSPRLIQRSSSGTSSYGGHLPMAVPERRGRTSGTSSANSSRNSSRSRSGSRSGQRSRSGHRGSLFPQKLREREKAVLGHGSSHARTSPMEVLNNQLAEVRAEIADMAAPLGSPRLTRRDSVEVADLRARHSHRLQQMEALLQSQIAMLARFVALEASNRRLEDNYEALVGLLVASGVVPDQAVP
ncbi:uncharacterized protein AMSG_05610 [Thecamonas trahens ATCC 50062]|uniref:Uncharacterized protein n=1 Tax=Thecamonas trahens ATCC 50062 TaxID=461836 RepID=A0A0L0DB69_THETB|nr:hypothetical protein AMSG_05610 [Thecamonas trahens ATCC 50062]KNC49574.1 hypothetical protein AMSG_05610 [Thecamonas trahens ATCC 50062]|eukprot:XP_013757683.1 hypothetical protein AMSG_05610 [Thecamonas trahens ATCC 50062]